MTDLLPAAIIRRVGIDLRLTIGEFCFFFGFAYLGRKFMIIQKVTLK
ncbi:MAG: hypothetical protein OEV30_13495 [Ignavibacteria bacterium]|nr:hypothetical protein [Ignavibacteria bacterium]